jgi:hypothetical protein
MTRLRRVVSPEPEPAPRVIEAYPISLPREDRQPAPPHFEVPLAPLSAAERAVMGFLMWFSVGTGLAVAWVLVAMIVREMMR